MRLLTFLESVETDREALAISRRAADDIVAYVTANNNYQAHGMEAKGGDTPLLAQYVAKMLKAQGWGTEELEPFQNLILILKPSGKGKEWKGTDMEERGGYGSAGPKHRAIVLHSLLPENPWKFVDTRLGTMKATLIHELTHHMDWIRGGKRWKDDTEKQRTQDALSGNLADYYSDPSEYNAYFNEVLEDIDITFNRVLEKVLEVNPEAAMSFVQRALGSNFQEFAQNITKSALPENFVLHPKFRKKFMRRLYMHYVELMAALKQKGMVESEGLPKYPTEDDIRRFIRKNRSWLTPEDITRLKRIISQSTWDASPGSFSGKERSWGLDVREGIGDVAMAPDATGWTHGKTLKTISNPGKIGKSHTPHWKSFRPHAKEMGLSDELVTGAVDEFAGPAQMQVYENGWLRWIYDSSLSSLGTWLSISTTLEGYRKYGSGVMKLVKHFGPDSVSLDVVDPSKPTGLDFHGGGQFDKPADIVRWLKSLQEM